MARVMIGVIGFLIAGLGGFGMTNAIQRWDEQPRVNIDKETTGKVSYIEQSDLLVAGAVSVSRSFKVKYEYTVDGKLYRDEATIDKDVVNRLSEGQPVRVMYHSAQPYLSGIPDYAYYCSVEELGPPASPKKKVIGTGVITLFGTLMVLGAIFLINDGAKDEDENATSSQN
ncbi:MAG: DUF3592 domain-containing protein [Planctomycetota bacterium]